MSELSPSIVLRPKSIHIGYATNITVYYEWKNIKSINWKDTSPWVHIGIPGGPMVHQHLHSIHVEGEIKTHDFGSMYQALFLTVCNIATGQTAINPTTGRKYAVDYMKFFMIDHTGTEIEFTVTDFKVNTLGVDNIELGLEALWIITFTADIIVISD